VKTTVFVIALVFCSCVAPKRSVQPRTMTTLVEVIRLQRPGEVPSVSKLFEKTTLRGMVVGRISVVPKDSARCPDERYIEQDLEKRLIAAGARKAKISDKKEKVTDFSIHLTCFYQGNSFQELYVLVDMEKPNMGGTGSAYGKTFKEAVSEALDEVMESIVPEYNESLHPKIGVRPDFFAKKISPTLVREIFLKLFRNLLLR